MSVSSGTRGRKARKLKNHPPGKVGGDEWDVIIFLNVDTGETRNIINEW